MTTHKVNITSSMIGHGSVQIDDHDISAAVRRVQTDISPGRVPAVELDLGLIEVTSLDCEQAEVLISREQHDALVRLGWTPPAGQEDR